MLNYKQFGEGAPIIILHGLFGMLDNWQTIAKKLAEKNTVFVVDMRNHGSSPNFCEHNYQVMAEDVKIFLESQGVYKTTIIGHSMGGKVAMQFALSNPDMVTQLIVVDIAPKAYRGGHEPILTALSELDLSTIKNRKEAEDFLSPRIENFGERQFILKNLTRNLDGAYEWKMNLPVLLATYGDILKNVESDVPFEGKTLFIRGELSRYIKDSDESQIHHFFPNAKLITIPNAGHWVHADNPTAFIEALIQAI